MKFPEFLKVNRTPRCCHTRNDGTACNAPPQAGRKYCFFHDPRQQKKRAAANRNGGFMRNRRPQPAPLLPPNLPRIALKTPADVAGLYEETINQVRQGEMELRAATTICYLANSLVHALDVASRAERAAAQEDRASRKKHPAPLKLTVYDHTGRIIDQIPPDSDPVPLSEQKQNLSPQINADQRGLPFLRTEHGEPRTVLSNTPAPTAEQGMSAPQQVSAAPSDKGTAQPSAPVLRTENGEPRTVSTPPSQKPQPIQYPPGMGPRHLGPGPGGSLMAGTPSMPWWRRRERINPMYITGTSARAAEMRAANARSRRTPR